MAPQRMRWGFPTIVRSATRDEKFGFHMFLDAEVCTVLSMLPVSHELQIPMKDGNIQFLGIPDADKTYPKGTSAAMEAVLLSLWEGQLLSAPQSVSSHIRAPQSAT